MSGFSPEWLSLREPIDHAARSEEVLSAITHYFMANTKLDITDIGCGTGSTLRALKSVLGRAASWHLIDNDDALLSSATDVLHEDRMVFTQADLSVSLDPVFSRPASLITTSAFLDLVSQSWLENFASEVTRRGIPFYAALSYDGRSGCSPKHELDERILRCFNQHQRGDKGFGPALGPDAARTATNLFRGRGYEIISEQSDWNADADHNEFQTMLIEGWHQAACEIDPANTQTFDEWLDFRRKQVSTGDSTLFVGHIDFFAVPK